MPIINLKLQIFFGLISSEGKYKERKCKEREKNPETGKNANKEAATAASKYSRNYVSRNAI